MNRQDLQSLLCKTMCADVVVDVALDGLWRVTTPFVFPDGDEYSLYLKQLPSGGWRVGDLGSTLMHLSYEGDIGKFREGSRGRLFAQILADAELSEDDGEFFIDTPADGLGGGCSASGRQ